MSSQAHRVLNWVPSLHDDTVRLHAPLLRAVAMEMQDMEAACPPVYDQGSEGSCVANAVVGAFEMEERLQSAGKDDPGPASRQAVYYWARALRGNQGHDTGSTITDGMTAALNHGLPPETLWPYSRPLNLKPTPEVDAAALHRRPTDKMIVRVQQDLSSLYAMLAASKPICAGFTVYTSFMGRDMERTGVWHGIQKGDKVEGGHAVAIVGYNPVTRMFKFRNSWGADWGVRGYFWMPETFVLSKNFGDFKATVAAPMAA